MQIKKIKKVFILSMIPLAFAAISNASATPKKEPWELAQETEVWTPVPDTVVASEKNPPSDALVLFDGKNLDKWEGVDGGSARWAVNKGVLTVSPKTGDIKTKEAFCDIQLHVEWKTPEEVRGLDGQGRGNSGIFLQERYEIQILDSYKNETYPNGQAGSVYKQSIPLVNASRAPGAWQTYDIIFQSPKFDEDGTLIKPAYITVLHNNVLVQNHFEIQGPTAWIGHPPYEPHGCAPLRLQDHGNPVSFRNIWVRKL